MKKNPGDTPSASLSKFMVIVWKKDNVKTSNKNPKKNFAQRWALYL